MSREWVYQIPCHRMPERCLHIKGKQIPLCARCFAILIGYLFFPIALSFAIVVPIWIPLLMTIPLLIDGYTQKWQWRTSNNTLRVATGLLFGIGQALFISTIVWTIVKFVN